MIIHITNLRLQTIIGTYEHERRNRQDVIINAEIEFDGQAASRSDEISDTVNYKDLADRVAEMVGKSSFFLLEKLCGECLKIIMSDAKVRRATVRIDKPRALDKCDSVSVTDSARRES